LCVTGNTENVCTIACLTSTTVGAQVCPTGMHCLASDQGTGVCWPNSPGSCGQDVSKQLNEQCFQAGATKDQDEYWPCGPNLLCFIFPARCSDAQAGACVQMCNATDQPCPETGQTCCYAVDSSGNCLKTPQAGGPAFGGCFHLRGEGQSCVLGENSICASGTACYDFGDKSGGKLLPHLRQQRLRLHQACLAFTLTGCTTTTASLCCNSGTGTDNAHTCAPSNKIQTYGTGVACKATPTATRALGLPYKGGSACTSHCDVVTQSGCPAASSDNNLDGVADGGFTCVMISGEGRCWPNKGPLTPPGGTQSTSSSGGCCRGLDQPLGGADILLSVLLSLPLAAYWLHRRRRRLPS